ncbi:MAG: N-6 DNA methylase [Deltaproteobacteria bacterium]|nr:N-6 DNA methylase [Deltaproteobacteria bacterium]
MAGRRAAAADALAGPIDFAARWAAQLATGAVETGTLDAAPAALHAAWPALAGAALRGWAQALAPAGVVLSVLWTRASYSGVGAGEPSGAPRVTLADLGRIYERLLGLTPRWDATTATMRSGTVADHHRRRSGSYYTPPVLVARVVDAVMGPQLAAARQAPDPERALLALRVLDPACGSGHFLLAVGNALAGALAAVRGLSAASEAERGAIAGACLYGVDLDPTATDLCRANLWQWCGFAPDRALAIRAHVRCGDALLGLGPRSGGRAASEGIPDTAFTATAADDRPVARALRSRNAAERRDPQLARALAAMQDPRHADAVWLANAWCAAFVLPKVAGGTVPTNADLACAVRGVAVAETVREGVRAAAEARRFFHWRLGFPEVFRADSTGFDAVVGNPPYLNQLRDSTAADRATGVLSRACNGGLAGGYADAAALFWARVPDWLRPGGRAGLIVPHSVLVTADAEPVRRHLAHCGQVRGLWVAGQRAFADAQVLTCAPIWQRDPLPPPAVRDPEAAAIPRWFGAACAPAAPLELDAVALRRSSTWGMLAADLLGVPLVPLGPSATLAGWATATADFRDQYYGLEGYVVDLAAADPWAFAPIATAGLIDLAVCHHGARPTRLLRGHWDAPRVDVLRMRQGGPLGAWLADRQVPKILVATQTPVLEVWVDVVGATVPSVPVLTVMPRDPTLLWPVGAALASPVASAWAANHHAGAALALSALKLSASQLLDLPLPDRGAAAWPQAVRAFQAAHEAQSAELRAECLRRFAEMAVQCHGLDGAVAARVLQWWLRRARLP